METGRKHNQPELQAGTKTIPEIVVKFFVSQFSQQGQISAEQAAQVKAVLAEQGPEEAQKILDSLLPAR